MLKFILKKLVMMIPMLIVISLVVFLGLRSTGIDPLTFMVPPEVQSQSPEIVEQLREDLGLNDPLLVQYFRWLGNLLKGDLGLTNKGEDIAGIIADRLPYTLELSLYAMLFSSIIGIGIGIVSAIRQNGIVDYIGRVLAVLGQAVPQFLVGILMIWIFSIKMGIFPAANRVSPDATNAFVDAFMHLFLPVTTLTIGMVAVLMRYARNTMLEFAVADGLVATEKGIVHQNHRSATGSTAESFFIEHNNKVYGLNDIKGAADCISLFGEDSPCYELYHGFLTNDVQATVKWGDGLSYPVRIIGHLIINLRRCRNARI